ncbi:nuclear protein DGCR14 [Dichomitus squalens]|uniref:Nuclear protein DGCR14 n=1 Tax=Dichomitus squalens TaxID=114155 RepID=A0A4Q9N309_9APHY|nr:nuclear protein DGCR14 [Dichomitus squalens]
MSSTPGPSKSSQPPARSLDRQVVLDEDEYTEALSHIIARDFFPSLVHLDATNSYLDALQTQDPGLIQASVRRLEDLQTPVARARPWQTPSQTPYAVGPMDTPMRTPRTERGEAPMKRPRYETDMSLDAFQARYTSEDNSSFTQILEDENRRRKEKYSWAWDAQRRVEAQRERMLEGRERLLIEAPSGAGVKEKFRIEAPKPAGLIEAAPAEALAVYEDDEEEVEDLIDGTHASPPAPKQNKDKSGALVRVEKRDDAEREVVDVMAPKKDTRPAGVDGWKFRARNALMFPPDADVAPYNTSSVQSAEEAKGPPKTIKHGNTRLPEQDDKLDHSLSAPPSPTRSRVDAAIAGTPYRPRSPTNDLHSLVPSVPSPTPSELGPAAVKQLMTWGTLNATPRVLSQSDDPVDIPTPSTPFRIAAPSSRERLSHKLSSDAAKSLRAKATLLGGVPLLSRSSGGTGGSRRTSMPPPSFTPRRADAPGSLTPAAKRLLDRTTMGTAASRRADAMGRLAGWEGDRKERDLQKVRWTPTPSPVTRRG